MSGGEYQIELVWRCSSCSQQNRGRDMLCARCGNPKEEHEEYEMPTDLSAAPIVSDPSLVALATAGANWRCRFCGSSARRPWGACAQCGAAEPHAGHPQAAHAQGNPHLVGGRPVPQRAPAHANRTRNLIAAAVVIPGLLVGLVGLVVIRAVDRPRPEAAVPAHQVPAPTIREAQASAVAASFVHTVVVERWAIVAQEGFLEARPQDALDVKSAGQRIHHHDRVQEGTTTETYTDYESKTETESYSARESCGQDCTTTPRTCRKSCTNNKNGFASCRDVCTGGDRRCSTKYCNVRKTRTVTKRVPVSKTRQVPKYVSVPRYAPFFTWKAWAWSAHRTLRAEGDGFDTRWPSDAELKLDLGLAQGEKERERRAATYRIELAEDDGTRHSVPVSSHDEYQRFRDARAVLRIEGEKASVVGFVPGATTTKPESAPTAAAPSEAPATSAAAAPSAAPATSAR